MSVIISSLGPRPFKGWLVNINSSAEVILVWIAVIVVVMRLKVLWCDHVVLWWFLYLFSECAVCLLDLYVQFFLWFLLILHSDWWLVVSVYYCQVVKSLDNTYVMVQRVGCLCLLTDHTVSGSTPCDDLESKWEVQQCAVQDVGIHLMLVQWPRGGDECLPYVPLEIWELYLLTYLHFYRLCI